MISVLPKSNEIAQTPCIWKILVCRNDVDNLHSPLPLEPAGFSVLSSTSFFSLPFFVLHNHLPFCSEGTLPCYFASIFCLKHTRFAVTWRATVFACEPGPWPEAAFLSSPGVVCLGGSTLGHCTKRWPCTRCKAVTVDFVAVAKKEGTGPSKAFFSLRGKKNERGNHTEVSGVSNS